MTEPEPPSWAGSSLDPDRIAREIILAGEDVGEMHAGEAQRLAATVAGIAARRSGGRTPTWQEVDSYIEEALVEARRIETAVAFALRQTQEVPAPAHINGVAQSSIQELHAVVEWARGMHWLISLYPVRVRRAVLSGVLSLEPFSPLTVADAGWDAASLIASGASTASTATTRSLSVALRGVFECLSQVRHEIGGTHSVIGLDAALATRLSMRVSDAALRRALGDWLMLNESPVEVGFAAPVAALVLGNVDSGRAGRRARARLARVLGSVLDVGRRAGGPFQFPEVCAAPAAVGEGGDRLRPFLGAWGVAMPACRLHGRYWHRIDAREWTRGVPARAVLRPATGVIGVAALDTEPLLTTASGAQARRWFTALFRAGALALSTKRNALEQATAGGVLPRTRELLQGVHDRLGKYWANHVGYLRLTGDRRREYADLAADLLARHQELTGEHLQLLVDPPT